MLDFGTHKGFDVIRDVTDHVGRPVRRAGLQGVDQTFKAEFLALVIHGFGGSVGVEQDAITSLHLETEIGANSIEDLATVNPESHAFRAQFFHLLGGGAV